MALLSLSIAQPVMGSVDIQRQFSEALEVLERDPQRAIHILEKLNSETEAVRIKLELARALFINGQLHESRALFLEIIEGLSPNTPPQVFENIEYFLSEIHKRLNPVRLGFSFVRDSNPTLTTETQIIELFGLQFQYTPPSPIKEEFGLKTNLDFQFSPTVNTEITGQVSHTQYETENNSRSYVLPEFRYRLSNKNKLWVRVGLEQEYQNRKLLRNGYFLGLRKYDDLLSRQIQTMTDLKVITNEYPDFKTVNGKTYDLSTFGMFRSTNNLILRANLGTDYTDAEVEQFRYRTYTVGYGFTYIGLPYQFEATIIQNHRFRRYSAKDLFFDMRREDDEISQSFSMKKRGFYIFGIAPSLNITHEQRFSNISIAEYTRTQVSLTGEKLF